MVDLSKESIIKNKWGVPTSEKFNQVCAQTYAHTMACVHALLVRKDESAAALYFAHKWMHYDTFAPRTPQMMDYINDLFLKSTRMNQPNPIFTMYERYTEIRYWVGNLRCQNPMVHDVCMALQATIDSPQNYVATSAASWDENGEFTFFAASLHPLDIATAVMGAGFEPDLLQLINDIKHAIFEPHKLPVTFLDNLQHIIETQHHTKFRDPTVLYPPYLYHDGVYVVY